MTVAPISDRIMETLLYKGPMTVEELSTDLQVQLPLLRRGLAMLMQEGMIEGKGPKGRLIQAIRHG